jgi:hypothetical protein
MAGDSYGRQLWLGWLGLRAVSGAYLGRLAAPGTIDTLPEKTLLAFADHGNLHDRLEPDYAAAERAIAATADAGIDADALAEHLQGQGAAPSPQTGPRSWGLSKKRRQSSRPEAALDSYPTAPVHSREPSGEPSSADI